MTCELHGSYFRLMTIKHAIPKTAEVTHSDGQLWGDIEWAIELLYNSVKTGSQLVLETRSWSKVVVEKAITQQKAGLPWATLENEKDTTLMAIRVGVNMLLFCLVLAHTTFQIKWVVYFSKRLCRSLSFLSLAHITFQIKWVVYFSKRLCR